MLLVILFIQLLKFILITNAAPSTNLTIHQPSTISHILSLTSKYAIKTLIHQIFSKLNSQFVVIAEFERG
jgi:hypothetical protein